MRRHLHATHDKDAQGGLVIVPLDRWIEPLDAPAYPPRLWAWLALSRFIYQPATQPPAVFSCCAQLCSLLESRGTYQLHPWYCTCLCMYIYIYICIHILYIYIHMYIYIYIHRERERDIDICSIYIYIIICVYIHICIYCNIYVCMVIIMRGDVSHTYCTLPYQLTNWNPNHMELVYGLIRVTNV